MDKLIKDLIGRTSRARLYYEQHQARKYLVQYINGIGPLVNASDDLLLIFWQVLAGV